MSLSAAILNLFGPRADCASEPSAIGDVGDYPVLHYSRKQVVKAGEALGRPMPYDPARIEEYSEIFRVAWDWRNSHAYPMRKLRSELGGKLRRAKAKGITAARMKRMKSIRLKLSRLSTTLVQIDDLGGCRAILDSVEQVNTVLDVYRTSNLLHKMRRDRSYIESPKPGGYRSHHLVYEFQGTEKDEEAFNGRRIEIQLRTRLQHAWATAVEAVGLVRGEDMKAGEGNPDWLRLFELLSSEFAEAENCPLVPNTPDRNMRLAEIKSLNETLEASSTLQNWNQAIKETEELIAPGSNYFLIQYDNSTQTVDVRGYVQSMDWPEPYSSAEEKAPSAMTTVLVEVDKVENLREAYPNYFLDMTLLTQNLNRILNSQPIRLTLQDDEPRKRGIVRGISARDLSWLESWRKRGVSRG